MSTEIIAGPLLFWSGLLTYLYFLEVARTERYRNFAIVSLFGGEILGVLLVISAISGCDYSPLWGNHHGLVFLCWIIVSARAFAVCVKKPEEPTSDPPSWPPLPSEKKTAPRHRE